jgi:membrane-bound inhibitor of C-type lysozyme
MFRKLALLALLLLLGAPSAQAQTVTYHCHDGSEFVAAIYQGTRAAYLQLDGQRVTLPRRVSALGARYSRGDITLRIRGKAVTLTRGRQSTECSAD